MLVRFLDVEIDDYELLDPTAPYVREWRPELEHEDMGEWQDLAPDRLEMVGPRRGRKSAALIRLIERRDGTVRDRLLRIGLTKAWWEAARPAVRRDVRDACRALDVLEEAATDALLSREPEIADAAHNLLRRMAELVKRDARSPHGLEKRKAKRWGSTEAPFVVPKIGAALAAAKAEALAARRDRYSDAKWLEEKVREVNRLLSPLPNVCSPALIAKLRTRRPMELARFIFARASPDVSAHDLGRSRPQTRRRPGPPEGAASQRPQ